MGRRIANIVNFVRANESRDASRDLITPFVEEIKLNKKYGFPNTFLLQYDALVNDKYIDVFKREADENMEIGFWFECVRQLVEAVGLPWRGDPAVTWDWHVVPGFLLAYTQDERKLLVDEAMRKFREVFGYLPKSVGSWMLDSWSVDYMSKEYGVSAFIICREQYGVDAYTLWGGYENQGYYPAKKNILCPAQTEEERVTTPVFRMLGPDPIYNYDGPRYKLNSVPTLEPAWPIGQNREAVDSLFKAHFDEECMDFAYVTIGQENGFGWEAIGKGLPYQLERLDALQKEGKIVVEKLCETGEWFKKTYTKNPTVSLITHEDWAKNGLQSVWFNCPTYRANLVLDNGLLLFRDIHKFDESYQERYLSTPCETLTAVQDNLPVVDGRLWNAEGVISGLKFSAAVSDISTRKDGKSLICDAETAEGKITVSFDENRLTVQKPADVIIYFERGAEAGTGIKVSEKSLEFTHNAFAYTVSFSCALTETEKGYSLGKNEKDVVITF